MDQQRFLDTMTKAIAQEGLSESYRRHRTSFLSTRLARMPAEDLERLKTMPQEQLEALLVTNHNEGSTARSQQVSHVAWLARYLDAPGAGRGPRRPSGETISVPVKDGFVRISGLRRRLVRGDVDRIIRAVRLWAE